MRFMWNKNSACFLIIPVSDAHATKYCINIVRVELRAPAMVSSHSHVGTEIIFKWIHARAPPSEFCSTFDAPAPILANPSRRKCVARATLPPLVDLSIC